ncbi:hypothetical protein L1887_35407 [Cichorium endivia]|nr:hypothetical protein L1887_35407 [Cichorium endivia]
MDLIHKFLNVVLPILTITLLVLLWPIVLLFRFFNYFLRFAFPEKLAGKVALITGASSGIGEYLAYEYAKRGARLALVARREEQLEVVAERAKELGSPDVIVISADVSKLHDCERFVNETINHFGTLDHLVNNAGVCYVQDQRCSSDYVSLMASKAALISFFETMRVEVGSDIGITIVTPGVVKSDITNDQWLLQRKSKGHFNGRELVDMELNLEEEHI